MKAKLTVLIIAGLVLTSCNPKGTTEEKYASIPIVEKAVASPESVYYANHSSYPKELKPLPIGVFDSGTGGLTVLEAFLGLDVFNNVTGEEGSDGVPDFKGENFIYLADQANMPYGNYFSEGKQDYLRELVVKDALFITKEPNRTKIIVIACNAATAYGLRDIENLLERGKPGISVVGVINAGTNASLDNIKGDESSAIGVMATVGTIASGGYENTIHRLAKERGYKGEIKVINQPGLGFAEAVDMISDYIDKKADKVRENYRGPKIGTDSLSIALKLLDRYNFQFGEKAMLYKKTGDKFDELQLNSSGNYARFHLVSLVEKHREKNGDLPLKNIILGCTHYPFLLDTLNKVLDELRNYDQNGVKIYESILPKDLIFIDPAVNVAKEVYQILRGEKILNNSSQLNGFKAYITVPSPSLPAEHIDKNGDMTYKFKYGREVGTELQHVEYMPFSTININPYNLQRIKERLPLSYLLIKNVIK